jgi:uncharacterized protein
MAAFRFINLLMIVAALASSAFAAYIFFGRTEIDEVEQRLSAYESRIQTEIPKAKAGDAKAQYLLGRLYRYGEARNQNFRAAHKWFKTAAGRGHAGAQYELGKMYAKGVGVGQSYHRAVEWFNLAAKIGAHRSAQFSLGELHYFGRGVDVDYVDARNWFLKAAGNGHPIAQYYLGEIFEKGRGVSPDPITAYKWYTLALPKAREVKRNNPKRDPKAALTILKSRLNRSQLAAGEAAVKAWKKTP